MVCPPRLQEDIGEFIPGGGRADRPWRVVDDIHHGFLLAFEDLQKGATLIEEHPRNAKLGIGFTGFYQQCFKLSFGEEL